MNPTTSLCFLLLLLPATLSAPSPAARQYASPPPPSITFTGQNECETESIYTLCQAWPDDAPAGGDSTAILSSASTQSISFESSWSWPSNSSDFSSFVFAYNNILPAVQLANISSIPTVVDWRWLSTSTDYVGAVGYRLYLTNDPTSPAGSSGTQAEILVWLQTRGSVQPRGSLLATSLDLPIPWDLYSSPASTSSSPSSSSTSPKPWPVYTFLSSCSCVYTENDWDLALLLSYLVQEEALDAGLWVAEAGVQGGVESGYGASFLRRSERVGVRLGLVLMWWMVGSASVQVSYLSVGQE